MYNLLKDRSLALILGCLVAFLLFAHPHNSQMLAQEYDISEEEVTEDSGEEDVDLALPAEEAGSEEEEAPSKGPPPAPPEVTCKDANLYFPPTIVESTLKDFNVSKDAWNDILDGLADEDEGILEEVETRAAELDPNPMEKPSEANLEETRKIFRAVLFESFSSVLKEFAPDLSDDQLQKMLDDIQTKKLSACFKERKGG